MRGKSYTLWMGVVVLLLSSWAAAQSRTAVREHLPLPGPLPSMDDPALNAAAVNYGGTFTFTFNIQVKSGQPNTDVISCMLEASTNDGTSVSNPFGRTIVEEGTAIGTWNTATTATCKVSYHYNWSLTTQATDTVNLQYSVTIAPPSNSTTAPSLQHTTSQGYGSMPVPPTGTVTAKTVPVTL